MLEVKKKKIGDYYAFEITNGDKVFTINFGGNLDLYWSCFSHNDNNQDIVTFDITKENYYLYMAIDELYNSIKGCHIFDIDSIELDLCGTIEERIELYKRNARINSNLKKSLEYKRIFDGQNVRWTSDDESFNQVIIIPGNDKYLLKFTPGQEQIYLTNNSIRFSNSGSMNAPFNIPFMMMYNKLCSDEYDFNQMHMEEVLYDIDNQAKLSRVKRR